MTAGASDPTGPAGPQEDAGRAAAESPFPRGATNRDVVRRYYDEAWNGLRLEVVDELVDAEYQPGGPEGEKRLITGAHTSFPDIHFTVDDLMAAEGDSVIIRWTARGTQEGKFRGIAPTGAQVTWAGISIYRLAGGRLIAGWSRSDQLGLLQQLGATVALPKPPAEPAA
jgi:predicted ester cyclase